MRIKSFEIKSYHNKLQGLSIQAKPLVICLDKGEYLYPKKFHSIDISDAIEFESGLGRILQITYNDIIVASEKDILMLEYEIPEECKQFAILYHIVDIGKNLEWIYAEVYKGFKKILTTKLNPPIEDAIKELSHYV